MIKKIEIDDLRKNKQLKQKLLELFDHLGTSLVRSFLQGHMGHAWVDCTKDPSAVQVIVDMFVYYAGNPQSPEATALIRNHPDWALAITNSKDWDYKIQETLEGRCDKLERFLIREDPTDLNIEKLESLQADLPEGYELRKMNRELLDEPSLHAVSKWFVNQFSNYDDFINRGIGFCIIHKDRVVSGASSYVVYDEAIEVGVATDPDHQRKGLATAASAALLIHCLRNGIYPRWDAADRASVSLARKLGYKIDKPYELYGIRPEGVS